MNKPQSILLMHIDIVHGCQLQCVGCPNSTLMDKVKPIDVADFATILGNIDVKHVHTLRLFNFGEPLLHRQLDKIVAEIPRQKWKPSIVEISTNAQFVDWGNFEEMLKLQVVNRIAVSCDGDGTVEKYEALRPPSKADRLIHFLSRTRELCERWSPATRLITRTIIEKESDKKNWQKFLLPRGWEPEFRKWSIMPDSVTNPSGRPANLPTGACYFLADAAEFTAINWHGEPNLLFVDSDGTVVPCCFHPRAGNFGNLLQNKFSEILGGEERHKFKSKMNSDRRSLPVCSRCEVGAVGHEGPSFLGGRSNFVL
jgi:radical SAM protein with 4Fe4S-binding SPASM domain